MLCLLPAAALAAPPPQPPAVPAAAVIYGPDDPDAATKARIEALMGVYLVDPPRRHETERVNLVGGQVRIDVWHPVGGLSDAELKTRAVRWLVFGRTQYAPGVGGVFGELPQVNEVIFVFQDVTRPDQRGRRKSKLPDQVKKYLAIKLDRRKFERLNMRVMEQCVAQGDCSTPFDVDFTRSSFDARYTAAQRSEEQ